MTARLTSEFVVKALLRRVHAEGGSGAVLARGDAISGAILLLLLDRGVNPRFLERLMDFDGRYRLAEAGPANAETPHDINDYWQRRCRNDPDLWVVELDIAAAERLAAETIVSG
ncbi:DUF1491 family protein [Stakelama saccharophila]|uniref:DUF1491 family protein n=1 Tax=Stakelama saccharophila TaxID=3075605 RepID=A0ABZ0BA86_9SPHN|nr:DUF1491 family protein [Stakelama sp. W311]WNO53995.1 DUF1491 family protein [Stakelama sp. W311]